MVNNQLEKQNLRVISSEEKFLNNILFVVVENSCALMHFYNEILLWESPKFHFFL